MWFEHVQLMDDQRIPKQIFKRQPEGKKEQGRPRISWREGIDAGLKKVQRLNLEE